MARRGARLGVLLAVTIAMVGLAQGPSGATTTWSLVNLNDSRCYQIGGGSSPGSYAVKLKGTWSKPISVGIDHLAPGAIATPLQSPIPAGASDGTNEIAYVRVDVARRQAIAGTYTMSLWASDGTSRQQVAVTLIERTTRCVAY